LRVETAERCPQRGVRIGELGVCALAATLGDEPLAVGVGGHVGAVDGDVAAKFGKLRVQARGHAVEAAVEHVAVGAELRRVSVRLRLLQPRFLEAAAQLALANPDLSVATHDS
jgi:dTDP-4-amino-4,6-dideoxygalactose transaminase